MGKNKYGAAKAMNVAVVGSINAPANITKKNISASDTFNAGREYKNQEGYRLPSLEEIYHIPSAIKRGWDRMSKAEKIVYGTIFASTVIGLGIAADYKHNEGKTVKKIGDYSKSAGKKITGGAAFFFGDFFKSVPPAAIVVPAANASAVATQVSETAQPNYETPFLMYDGIKIIGNEQFQKDNLMWMEFAKKYSPADYEFFKQNNKWIDETTIFERAAGGGGSISWNKKFLRELIENKKIKEVIGAAAHETGHNFADSNPDIRKQPNYDAERFAQSFAGKAYANVSYVNQSEIDKFYKEFNFSQFKK